MVGSVARGTARPTSDVDVYLVVTDEAYADARAAGMIAAVSQDGVTYPGGYVDIKLASTRYLTKAVEGADDVDQEDRHGDAAGGCRPGEGERLADARARGAAERDEPEGGPAQVHRAGRVRRAGRAARGDSAAGLPGGWSVVAHGPPLSDGIAVP